MQISSESRKVSELFPILGNVHYHVPSYQRGYSWRDEQIGQLFEDIRKEDAGYYAGNILLTGDEDSFSVIDGQQRLTTISLFLLAIGERLAEYSHLESAIGLKLDIRRQLLDSTGEPRVVLLDQDQVIYLDLLGALHGKHHKKWGNRSFIRRYRYIKELFGEDCGSFEKLNEFYQKLMQVDLLRVTVPNLGDAFTVFSSLNSKGLPLTLIDLLKGEFLSAAQKIGELPSQTLAQWNTLAQMLSADGEDVNTGVVTQFLLNNWDAFESSSLSSTTKTKALSQYQRLLPIRYGGGENYLQVLIGRAEVFSRISQLNKTLPKPGNLDEKLASLKKLESTQALPLLMYLLSERDALLLDENDLTEIADNLVAFYVRRNVALTPKSSNIRARLIGVMRSIQRDKISGCDVVDVVKSALLEMSVSDEQFRVALNQPLYDKSKATARYILIDIERRIGGGPTFDKGHPDNLDQYLVTESGKVTPIWSIEHILPEGDLPKWWVKDIAEGDCEKAAGLQSEYVHMLGNLTLTPYNSELGQKPFYSESDPFGGSKRDLRDKGSGTFVGLRSGLYLNKSIADESRGEHLEEKRTWTVEDIVRRNAVLSDLVIELYRRD